MKYLSGKKGFSLVEVLLTLALLGIMVVIIGGAVSLSKIIFVKNSNESVKEGNVKRALEVISRDLREARRGISSCTDLNEPNQVCILPTGISFKVPEQTSESGEVTYKKILYEYNAEDATLGRTEISSLGAVTSSIIGRTISAASFEGTPGEHAVQIQLSSDNITQSTEVYLRNA